jgi:hypothetical protein
VETKEAAGKIMLFQIPKHTQLTFVWVYEDQTSKTLADGDSEHHSIILIATVDDLPQCQQRQDTATLAPQFTPQLYCYTTASFGNELL